MDLDGTVLNPQTALSERTVRAVKACRQRGLRIIIATGRSIDGAEPFREALGVEGPMIYCNGAVVADIPAGRLISSTLLDKEAASCCVDISRELGAYFQVFFPRDIKERRAAIMAEYDGPEREMYFNHTGIRAEIGNLKQALSQPDMEGCIKGIFLAEPEAQIAIRAKIEERLGKGIYIVQTLRTFLEVMNTGVSKGQGLKLVMEHCAIKREEVLAFGDEENDLPMFTVAGFAAAPSNAKESVKSAADIVIGSNAEDGVAAFLEMFFRL